MVIEIKCSNGSIFAIDTEDIKEIGEHETGGTYICMYDGTTMLLNQDYETFKSMLRELGCEEIYSTDFTLMSAEKYKMLKKRVKSVKQKRH